MTLRRRAFIAGTVATVASAMVRVLPAYAHHKPGHNRGGPPVPTSTSTTTTTTTTTTAPPLSDYDWDSSTVDWDDVAVDWEAAA